MNQQKSKNFILGHRRYKTQAAEHNKKTGSASRFSPEPQFKSHMKTRRYNTEVDEVSVCEEIANQTNSGRKDFQYNKWYIRPKYRMKMSMKKSLISEHIHDDFVYNSLYQQKTVKDGRPFETVTNKKLQFLQRIPVQNARLLVDFKRVQQEKSKRVPKIVDLFLKKKNNIDRSAIFNNYTNNNHL